MHVARIAAIAISLLATPALAADAPPRMVSGGDWLTKRETPAGHLKQGERAMTAIRITVAPDGSVARCDVAYASRPGLLDEYACSLFVRNARYEPLAPGGDAATPRIARHFWQWDAPPSARNPASKAVPPTPWSDVFRWVTTDDLPKGALERDQEVISNVELAISDEGRVTGCRVTAPSDRPDLDQRVCLLMQARARYRPARDAAGTRVPSADWKTVRWQVPRD